MIRTPLKRKKPMARAKPSVRSAQHRQHNELQKRSHGRCEMDVPSPIPGDWMRCSKAARDVAHVYTRPKCGGARDHVDAVIHACRRCHELSQGKLGTALARIPLWAAQAAWDRILDETKLGIDYQDRLRIHIGSLGLRPKNGFGPYG